MKWRYVHLTVNGTQIVDTNIEVNSVIFLRFVSLWLIFKMVFLTSNFPIPIFWLPILGQMINFCWKLLVLVFVKTSSLTHLFLDLWISQHGSMDRESLVLIQRDKVVQVFSRATSCADSTDKQRFAADLNALNLLSLYMLCGILLAPARLMAIGRWATVDRWLSH